MPPAVGMRFGRYELLEKVGAGGMGEVYRARDHDLLRDVAVKFLPEPFTSSSERLARFTQEARTASALNHPNIVTVHEIGTAHGQPFIVTELVVGRTLRQILRDEKHLDSKAALGLAAQIAEGLARAHAAGIVHRDLKPENVMVTPDGLVKILDFGLAKLHGGPPRDEVPQSAMSDLPTWPGEEMSPATRDGAVLGTAGYMSPEQARSKPVDHRSDQFALGSTLYEMVTGQRAFNGETRAQAIAAIIEKDPEPIARLCPGLPAPARWVVERCLAKDPADRYASTLDLARELRGIRDRLSEVGPSGSFPSGPLPGGGRERLGRALPMRGVAAMAVPVVLAVAVGLQWPRLASWLDGRPALPFDKRVAVLPFEVESPDPEDEFRADGLLEALTSRLGELQAEDGDLVVIPSSDVWQSGARTVEAARRAFDVNLVVVGRLEREGDRLRVFARLEDAANGESLRTLPIRELSNDTRSTRDEMARGIASLLDLRLPGEGDDAGPADRQAGPAAAGAYADYVQARGHMQRFERQENVEKAISLLQRALEQDPAYAPAYAGLGEAYWRLYEITKRPELVPLARENCDKALSLNELLASAHVTLGLIERGTGQPGKAIEDLNGALAREPRNPDALRELGRTQMELGQPEAAEESLGRALELRPTDWAAHNYLGILFMQHDRLDDAEREFRRVIALNPEIPRGYTNLGALCYRRGDLAEAEKMFRRSAQIQPTSTALSNLGTTLFYLARYVDAAEAFEEAVALEDRSAESWLNLGRSLFMSPGRRAEAREPLERARSLLEAELEVNPRDPGVLIGLADVHAMSGRRDEARAFVSRALSVAPEDAQVLAVAASVHELGGDRDAALRALRAALRAGYHRWEIERDPAFESLRTDPGYAEALAEAPPPSSQKG